MGLMPSQFTGNFTGRVASLAAYASLNETKRARKNTRTHCAAQSSGRNCAFPISYPNKNMPKYLIEREIPEAGKLTREQLQGISQKSCDVLKNLGPQIQWVESYVTDDKVYCVYVAPSESLIREHAKQGGFPANRISEVRRMIDPTTAET
jgi:hypothetical protein